MRGLVRVGAAVPSLALGNVKENMKRHLAMMREAKEKHVSIVTFPELSLTGYTCGDLFFQRRLLDDVTDALLALKDEMPEGILAVVGAPLEIEGALYNCAVVLHNKARGVQQFFLHPQFVGRCFQCRLFQGYNYTHSQNAAYLLTFYPVQFFHASFQVPASFRLLPPVYFSCFLPSSNLRHKR